MKSSFSRFFYPAVIVLLLALCSVGLVFQIVARNILKERALDRLTLEAQTASRLLSAYYENAIAPRNDLFIDLSVISQATGSNTVVCDNTGVLVLCSDAPMGCEHQGLHFDSEYLYRVFSSGCVTGTGYLRQLYPDMRYSVAVPIRDSQGHPMGAVISSIPVQETVDTLRSMTNIYILSASIAVLLAITIMIWVALRHTKPLNTVRKAAVAFGHGDLTARVVVDASHPEEIQELSLAFNNMAESLQKSEYRRQEFVANVSHELKTPMTTIAGFADGILDGTIPPEKQSYYLQLISDETKRLNRLVRSMLDASRLQEQAGIPEDKKSRFDMTECAGQVLLSFEQKITAKNLDVQVDFPEFPVYTRAQQDQIVQVVYNLLENAVKFCPDSGTLELKLYSGGNKIYVSIANSGQTIPPEELPLVFDRFHKLDKSRSENRDSWGLGLYIVKTIIGAHEEDISVVSRDNRTEFTFTLPLVN